MKTEQQIIDGNELIAEFMGYKFKSANKYWCLYPLDDNSFLRNLGWVEFKNLKFHSSWDWLIPVINNIPEEDYCCFCKGIYIVEFGGSLLTDTSNMAGVWGELVDYLLMRRDAGL